MSLHRYEEFMRHLSVGARDKTLIALKGHLLLETALREYIYRRVSHPDRLKNKQVTFSSLIDFASCLEDDNKIQWVWKALRKANTIRNQLAHQLEPQALEKIELELVDYVEQNDGEFSVSIGDDLDYEKLALIYFQLFDVLLSSQVRDESSASKSDNKYSALSFIEVLKIPDSFSNSANGLLTNKPSYSPPPRSKKRRKVW